MISLFLNHDFPLPLAYDTREIMVYLIICPYNKPKITPLDLCPWYSLLFVGHLGPIFDASKSGNLRTIHRI